MNAKTRFLVAIVGVFGSLQVASAAVTVGQVEVTELSLHRTERLVDLGKIDETFVTNFKSLTFEALPGTIAAGQAAFRITQQQVPGANGTAKKIELLLDSDGRPVPSDFKVIEGADSLNPPAWPDKTGMELAEESLHAIERLNKPEYQPFVKNLASLSLSPAQAADGSLRGLVVLTANGTKATLEALVTKEGKVDGDPVVKAH